MCCRCCVTPWTILIGWLRDVGHSSIAYSDALRLLSQAICGYKTAVTAISEALSHCGTRPPVTCSYDQRRSYASYMLVFFCLEKAPNCSVFIFQYLLAVLLLFFPLNDIFGPKVSNLKDDLIWAALQRHVFTGNSSPQFGLIAFTCLFRLRVCVCVSEVC